MFDVDIKSIYIIDINCAICHVQLMYDKSGCGKPLRHWMASTLGWWHPYKQGVMTVWRLGAQHFWAPLYHAICPGAMLFKKMKLVTLVLFFSYVRLAYPRIKGDLQAALADTSVKPKFRLHLKNLEALMEFFIPSVKIS
jgi:hypothetical protein